MKQLYSSYTSAIGVSKRSASNAETERARRLGCRKDLKSTTRSIELNDCCVQDLEVTDETIDVSDSDGLRSQGNDQDSVSFHFHLELDLCLKRHSRTTFLLKFVYVPRFDCKTSAGRLLVGVSSKC